MGETRKKGRARASREKWRKIQKRAGELAMNQGKAAAEPSEHHVRRAERELLGLQTMLNPDDPLATKPV
jgi:hypothetical protein